MMRFVFSCSLLILLAVSAPYMNIVTSSRTLSVVLCLANHISLRKPEQICGGSLALTSGDDG